MSTLDALEEAGCDPVFAETISTRIKVRPEFTKALDFARTIKTAVPHQRVIRPLPRATRSTSPPTPAGDSPRTWNCSLTFDLAGLLMYRMTHPSRAATVPVESAGRRYLGDGHIPDNRPLSGTSTRVRRAPPIRLLASGNTW
ncbi:hypothetical protein [Nonomuraea sp. 10N515B]|uniref:hypothetical protein n=1 Tax=Nonomuraea sp. 10N515B TaxID=3457422 RepID=UPI003FCCBD44